jgi:hypothetical protein
MIRRVLGLTVVAVALSAAGALAFVPRFSRAGRAWAHSGIWFVRGFTPVPPAHDPRATDDLLLSNEAVPGTYCPVRPRNSGPPSGSLDARVPTDSLLGVGASTAPQPKGDLLSNGQASCAVPPPAATPTRPDLP